MNDWMPIVLQLASVLLTIGGTIAAVSTRMARLEGRIESLATEIRKDREHVEHRIRQLEISLGQVQSELNRLAYHVGHRNGREQRQENGHE
ncbi:MAG: hypothetical protein OEV43_00460 [Coriobacteriia bacterium]|nr:hypothetical protein [Coriobacteriia bacterium]